LQDGGGLDQHVHTRTEFDEPHALAALQSIAHLRMENNSSRQQSRNLLENHDLAVAFHTDNILLVLLRGSLVHGIQELPALIANFAHDSRNRRTVHVHVEDAQEDADARLLFSAHRHH
jgi:hypothetical protein